MNSRKLKFVFSRDIPRIILFVFLIALVWLGFQTKLDLGKYSNLFLVGITALYAYLTYELLRITRANKASPYIKLELIFVSKLDSDFFKKYESSIDHAEDYLQVKRDFDNGTANDRNVVFLRAQNMGNGIAIGTEISIKFDKKASLDDVHKDLSKQLHLADLQEGDVTTRLFCVFDRASSNDFLEIRKAEVSFQDISIHNSGEGAWKYDATNNIGHIREDGVVVILKRDI